jgi:5-methyltetrahydrofolate--homocysteine methyltransferase
VNGRLDGVRSSLSALLSSGRVLLADGATGTNLFGMGLPAGESPEFWNVDEPDKIRALHQSFVDAGSDLILTNTFGCNRHRLKLHNASQRTYEIAKRAAELAGEVAAEADRVVFVAGSVGPTGELFEPLGALTHDEAVDTFAEEMRGLKDGGADLAWIETMSAVEEVRAAAVAAGLVGLPYTVTCSFDTAGRTMMGLLPQDLVGVFADLDHKPLAVGANCGVGASDTLVSILAMTAHQAGFAYICKGNCGIPQYRGAEIYYSGSPELMARYSELAVATGAQIVGGCCGTSPEHIRAMRAALDARPELNRPDVDAIVAATGPLVNAAPGVGAAPRERERRSSRQRS